MKKRSQAFTLAEMLIALAITSLLVILLVNVVSATLSVWQQGRNRIDTFANARQTLGRLADEIKGATAAVNQIEFSENLASIQGSSAPIAGTSENVFFVAPYPNSGAGDLCVIAYRHNSDTYTLERGFIDSQAAWNVSAATRYRSNGYTNANWVWRVVAEGVVEFEIRSYSQANLDNNQPPSNIWNSTLVDPAMTGNTPRRVVVRMKIVDDRGATRLKLLAVGSPGFNQVVAQSAREFSTEVELLPPH